jgi:hypothetical protein
MLYILTRGAEYRTNGLHLAKHVQLANFRRQVVIEREDRFTNRQTRSQSKPVMLQEIALQNLAAGQGVAEAPHRQRKQQRNHDQALVGVPC